MADELRLYSRVKGPEGRGKPDGKSECRPARPAREAAGTPAAGSVNWLSYLETGVIYGAAHTKPQDPVISLSGMYRTEMRTCVRQRAAAGVCVAAGCEAAQTPRGRRMSNRPRLITPRDPWQENGLPVPREPRGRVVHTKSGRSQKQRNSGLESTCVVSIKSQAEVTCGFRSLSLGEKGA